MSANEDETDTHHYYMLLTDVTNEYVSLADPKHPSPARVIERSVVTPDKCWHLCEATASVWVEVIDYTVVMADEDDDVGRDFWEDALNYARDEDSYYLHRWRLFDDAGVPRESSTRVWADMGTISREDAITDNSGYWPFDRLPGDPVAEVP